MLLVLVAWSQCAGLLVHRQTSQLVDVDKLEFAVARPSGGCDAAVLVWAGGMWWDGMGWKGWDGWTGGMQNSQSKDQ